MAFSPRALTRYYILFNEGHATKEKFYTNGNAVLTSLLSPPSSIKAGTWLPLGDGSGGPLRLDNATPFSCKMTVQNKDWAFGLWIEVGMDVQVFLGLGKLGGGSVQIQSKYIVGTVDNIQVSDTVTFDVVSKEVDINLCPNETADSQYAAMPGTTITINNFIMALESS